MSATNKFLSKMLDRLYASLLSGPGLNCRPHASRQRIDLSVLSRLTDLSPDAVLLQLLSEQHHAKISAKVPPPRRDNAEDAATGRRATGKPQAKNLEALTPEQEAAQTAWDQQQSLLNKLRWIVEDARVYTQDTGVHVLYVGFPLLSVPPGYLSAKTTTTRRILAPVAFIPIQITAKTGLNPSLKIECFGEGADLVIPNTALLAWIEQQTGQSSGDLFADEEGAEPWRELRELVAYVCKALNTPVPEVWVVAESAASQPPEKLQLDAIPKGEDGERPTILNSAVLGLFPMANQSLIRDMQEMAAQERLNGPVVSFLRVGESLGPSRVQNTKSSRARRLFQEERLVSAADPFQAQAVRLSREQSGLVIHGPPGTGKSQTIANIIGDHLARGERVLLVCDKRTALDVVANRLQHLGLGSLFALVHDPQRDKRDLYKGIREQLDALAEAPLNPGAVTQLAKVDAELQELHGTLSRYYQALAASPTEHGESFHGLVGKWLALAVPTEFEVLTSELADCLTDASLEVLDKQVILIQELLERARSCDWPSNPWAPAVGITLSDSLAKPADRWRSLVTGLAGKAQKADATLSNPGPTFASELPVAEQASARLQLATEMAEVLERCSPALIEHWTRPDKGSDAVHTALASLAEAETARSALSGGPLDGELAAAVREACPTPAQVRVWTSALDAYLTAAAKWYGFLYFSVKAQAREALSCFGLPLSPENAQRLKEFLAALNNRLTLRAICERLTGTAPQGLLPDEILRSTLENAQRLLALLDTLHKNPALRSVRTLVLQTLSSASQASALLADLRQSALRAEALFELESEITSSGLFSEPFRRHVLNLLVKGQPLHPQFSALNTHVGSLETVIRLRDGLQELPDTLRRAIEKLIQHVPVPEPEQGLTLLRKAVLAAEIGRHIRRHPELQTLDATRLERSLERYRTLDAEKKRLSCEVIVHRWRSRQKERLLATTGTRLNNLATELRRRLMLRGERALRLRQVIHTGQSIDGGDPLFDICPVWMASPETVAQIFPRSALFDVVIFDEASQCRLEEALPVLQRGKRVVIAGDPQQLPPTRFFESAVAVSNDEEPETDQDLFEQQQSEVEDLLNAALNLEIQQCYLDVHYRSRDADLIEFSNEHFYESRLQPIPAHPSQRQAAPAIRLIPVEGTYAQQCNQKEAERVCTIVRELLSVPQPPSIGIACFNGPQRDLILDVLDRAAAEDPAFAAQLTTARNRVGAGSFEGLFVKNLENVQGDERDHMIISTTYGPDPNGRFYRRFGPLGRSGGGRRLNVLVTRAREAVHLITSIPPNVYRSLPALPPGVVPSGAYLLFAYLQYAEAVAEPAGVREQRTADQTNAAIHVLPSAYPSHFAQALGSQLVAQHAQGGSVHWGNDGFCIDVALQHPTQPDDVTVGVLCDGPRFQKAPDMVEWDVFRAMILERQGWKLHRVWTPHFFRDPEQTVGGIVRRAREQVA